MSYETVIQQVKETPVELLDEVSVFLNFLKYRTQQENKEQILPDSQYNKLTAGISSVISNSAKATIWEQIKDDTW